MKTNVSMKRPKNTEYHFRARCIFIVKVSKRWLHIFYDSIHLTQWVVMKRFIFKKSNKGFDYNSFGSRLLASAETDGLNGNATSFLRQVYQNCKHDTLVNY
jgi:hypothetical protein